VSADASMEAGSDLEPAFVVPSGLADAQLWLIRHGETAWSRGGQHTSRTDVPLTANGERQASALRGMLVDVHPVFVLCSPRQRAVRTAQLAGLAVDAIDDDLVEWDYGEYEGMTTEEIRKAVPGWSLWTHPMPGGETPSQVAARADRVLARAAARLDEGPVVLVAHGHVCRVIGARWIGLQATDGARVALDTAAPSVLGTEHDISVIHRWNLPNPAVAREVQVTEREEAM
jgi:broad specificity phosphatase PhoE